MLISTEEILELKKAHHALERGMEKIEKSQRPAVARLSKHLKEMTEGIESVREREKTLWNPATSTRIRLAKKGALLAKELCRFEMEVAGEFENGNIPEDAGKRFVSIVKLIRSGKMETAKAEMAHFEEIAALGREYERAEEELREKERVLMRERLRIETTLREMAELEKESIDMEKVRRYKELLKNLEKLKGLRAAYIQSLLSKPVVELLGEAEGHSLKEYCGVFPEKDEMAQLRQFFSDYPVFGKCSAGRICEFFECSEKKLAHICPETSRFKRVVLENRALFETVGELQQTAFLAVDDSDEKTLDFYARNVGGARETVELIRQLKKEKHSDMEEYEKSRWADKCREKLAKYSKTVLEAELKDIGRLLELLHSESIESDFEKREPARGEAGEGEGGLPKKDAEGGHGLLSGIGSFIKKLAEKP